MAAQIIEWGKTNVLSNSRGYGDSCVDPADVTGLGRGHVQGDFTSRLSQLHRAAQRPYAGRARPGGRQGIGVLVEWRERALLGRSGNGSAVLTRSPCVDVGRPI